MLQEIKQLSAIRFMATSLAVLCALLLFHNAAFANDQEGTALVNAGHFAPFAADVEATSVTIKVTGEGVDAMLEDVKFGDIARGVELPAGVELTIQVIPTGTDMVAMEIVATLDADMQYTVAAIGGANGWELELLPLVDETMAPESGALVRIGHLAPFADAATPGSTAVDICTDEGTVLLPGVEYPTVSNYLPFEAGIYDLLIALAGTECESVALDLPPVALYDGDIVDVFAIGLAPDDANFPLQIAEAAPTTLTTAMVNAAHFAPFGADVDATSVSIKVLMDGGEIAALEDVKFGDIARDLELPARKALTIQIIPSGAEMPAIEETVALETGLTYTVAAIGGANGWELELLPLVDETMAPESGALVRVGHLAPFADAATPGSTAVDICTDEGTVLLPGVEYPTVSDYLPFPADTYDLLIALAGTECEAVALDLPPVALYDGDIVDVFAIGLAPDDANFPLQIADAAPMAPMTAMVNVAHFAPFGADVEATSVTVKVMGEGVDAMLEDVKFGDIARDVELPAGVELTIQVIPTGTDTVAIETMVTLDADMQYTVAAIGGANGWELELLPLVDETMAPESGALVRVGHLAPFADAATPGSTAVDICTDEGTVLLPEVEYPTVSDYLPFPADTYDLLIALAGTECEAVALDLPPVTLADGDIVDVFAIGLAPDDANFPLQIADRAVAMLNYYLPLISAGE